MSPVRRGTVALAAVAVVVLAGCGGGTRDERFTLQDARRLAAIRPVTPGWAWPRDPAAAGSSTGGESRPRRTDELERALFRRLDAVVGLGDVWSRWQDETKLGNLDVQVFESAAGAHEASSALRDFSRGWGERAGAVVRDEDVDGLGDEAWRLGVAASGAQVTYGWRRGNLVLEAHVHCLDACPPDVDAVTRGWVDAIDAEARTVAA